MVVVALQRLNSGTLPFDDRFSEKFDMPDKATKPTSLTRTLSDPH